MLPVCRPNEAGDIELKAQKEFQPRHKTVKRGDFIFRAGTPFHSLHVICSGSVKTNRHNNGGDIQIVGFHFPGDVIGMGGIYGNKYTCDVKALETTEICEFSFERLGDVIERVPLVRCILFRCMSNQIALNDSVLSPFLGKKSASDCLVTFFLDIANRLDRCGFDAQSFPLNISQADIGNYLGLAKETVSRLISDFQEKGLINIEARRIRIHRLDGLIALSRGI